MKSYKLKNYNYIDSESIVYKKRSLKDVLDTAYLQNDATIVNGKSKTFTLEKLKQYMLVVTQYGNGNVYANATRVAIITIGESTNNTSQMMNLHGSVADFVTVEFINGLTVKITTLTNKWVVISLTKL